MKISWMVLAVVLWNHCSKTNFRNSPSQQQPATDDVAPGIDPSPGVVDPHGPSAGGDDRGRGIPKPGSRLPTNSYTPGTPPPSTAPQPTPDEGSVPETPPNETPFVPCEDGSAQRKYPIFVKAYEYGVQGSYAGRTSLEVMPSVYYGINPELLEQNTVVIPLDPMLQGLPLVRETMLDLTKTDDNSPNYGQRMTFLQQHFLDAKIEETQGQANKEKFNYRTEFCMANYDVSNRRWQGGFPEVNANGASQLVEWFALRGASYFMVPESGEYKFLLKSDDGSVFQLLEKAENGVAELFKLDHDGIHSTGDAYTVTVTLNKDSLYIAHMRHFQGPRDYIGLQLYWQRPGTAAWEIVPPSAFTYDKSLIDRGGHRPY